MKADKKWSDLGWKHPLWDLVRYYLSLRGRTREEEFRETLSRDNRVLVSGETVFPIESAVSVLFGDYLVHRERQFKAVSALLRSESEALRHCKAIGAAVKKTTTQRDHHQSSKAVVAAVSALAEKVCKGRSEDVDTNPQTRCVWCINNSLHVSVRNIDGTIPSLFNPRVVWEIKEYWGKTSGGSKMSDAVYECHLVGLELRYFEEKARCKINHVVFVDGKDQWAVRQSDLKRFIDLVNQGLIDYLFVGKAIETEWESTVAKLLGSRK